MIEVSAQVLRSCQLVEYRSCFCYSSLRCKTYTNPGVKISQWRFRVIFHPLKPNNYENDEMWHWNKWEFVIKFYGLVPVKLPRIKRLFETLESKMLGTNKMKYWNNEKRLTLKVCSSDWWLTIQSFSSWTAISLKSLLWHIDTNIDSIIL